MGDSRAEPSRRRVAALMAGLVAAIVAAAAAAGWLLGTVATPEPEAPRPSTEPLRLGPLTAEVASDWRPVDRARDFAGLDPRAARAFAPNPGLASRAIVALTPAADATLLPPKLRPRLGDALPEPVATRVAGRLAWLYRAPAELSEAPMEVTVIPTTAGVVSIACTSPRASWGVTTGCADGMRRLALGGAHALAPAEDAAFRLRLPAAIERLNRRRSAARRALARSRRAAGQVTAAGALAAANARAAAELAPFAPAPGPAAGVTAGLQASAGAYRRLGRAARQRSPRAYRTASRAVTAAETAVARRLRELRGPGVSS
jgi:hypothetical protein